MKREHNYDITSSEKKTYQKNRLAKNEQKKYDDDDNDDDGIDCFFFCCLAQNLCIFYESMNCLFLWLLLLNGAVEYITHI